MSISDLKCFNGHVKRGCSLDLLLSTEILGLALLLLVTHLKVPVTIFLLLVIPVLSVIVLL